MSIWFRTLHTRSIKKIKKKCKCRIFLIYDNIYIILLIYHIEIEKKN